MSGRSPRRSFLSWQDCYATHAHVVRARLHHAMFSALHFTRMVTVSAENNVLFVNRLRFRSPLVSQASRSSIRVTLSKQQKFTLRRLLRRRFRHPGLVDIHHLLRASTSSKRCLASQLQDSLVHHALTLASAEYPVASMFTGSHSCRAPPVNC